ncbi:MAG: hypothetical protein M3454_04415 [Actinomycetota bacterium]|nr:hypothetical protein [Actinomycetota bacterium]
MACGGQDSIERKGAIGQRCLGVSEEVGRARGRLFWGAGSRAQGRDRLKPINLSEPRLVPLPPRDLAEAARLLAALMRSALGSRSGHELREDRAGPAADLPTAPLTVGKRRARKRPGEAA